MLAWTVDAAVQSGIFSNIVVSSEDAEILEIARSIGVESDVRPEHLATDTARNVEVLAEYLGRHPNFDTVCLLAPTSPLRTAGDIAGAFALRQADEFIVSVSRYEFPPEYAAELDVENGLHLRQPAVYKRSTQSQSLAPAVHPNGAIYLGSTARFLREGTFYVPPMRGFLMPPERSLDLDYPHQFAAAEAFLRTRL